MHLTYENMRNAYENLKRKMDGPWEPMTIEMPPIPPRLLPELIKRGYVADNQWTHAGLEWFFGVRVEDRREE